MADHFDPEGVLQEFCEKRNLLPHNVPGIFNEVRLVLAIVWGQGSQWRRIPSVEVHADLSTSAPYDISPELLKVGTPGHFKISQISRVQAMRLTERLESWEKSCVPRSDRPGAGPQIITLYIDGH